MSLINTYNEQNDPQQKPFNNQPPPVVAPSMPQMPVGLGVNTSINEPPLPIPDPASAINTESPVAPPPTDVQAELQKQTDREQSQQFIEGGQPLTEALPQQAELTTTELNSGQQKPTDIVSQFNMNATDEMLRKNQIDAGLVDETSLTQTHLPTVYAAPSDDDGGFDFNRQYNDALSGAKLLPGQVAANFGQQFLPEPAPRDNPRVFAPNSLLPSQFTQPLPEGSIKPWGDGWISSLMYGVGVIGNTARGGVIDAVRVRNNLVDKLPAPARNILNWNPYDGITGGFRFVRPDSNYGGSYTLDALRGRQYNFTDNYNDKNNPIGITGNDIFYKAADSFVQWNNDTAVKLGLGGIKPEDRKKNRWSVDPSYWVGFVADAVLDPSDIIGGKILEPILGRASRVFKARAEARAASEAVKPKRIIVTPPNAGKYKTGAIVVNKPSSSTIIPPPSLTVKPNVINKPDTAIDVEFTVVKPDAPQLKPAKAAGGGVDDIINTPSGDVNIPGSVQRSEQLALPYGEPYPLKQWDLGVNQDIRQITTLLT